MSCQALEDEPMHGAQIMVAMARSGAGRGGGHPREWAGGAITRPQLIIRTVDIKLNASLRHPILPGGVPSFVPAQLDTGCRVLQPGQERQPDRSGE